MAAQTQIVYSDFLNDMRANPMSGDVGMLVNQAAIKQSLRNLILTNKYERRINPSLGSNITASLFENMDGSTASTIAGAIRDTVANYEPRVNLINVSCQPVPQKNAMNVTIIYSIMQFPGRQTLQVTLNRIR
jgi:phage baseplate assembly protein W